MPVVLGDTDRDADRFRFTLADDVAVVETAKKLDDYLENHPDEDLIVVGPDVTMAVATEVAETYRLRRPFLGVVLMRRRMEISTMTEALRAGVREVVRRRRRRGAGRCLQAIDGGVRAAAQRRGRRR